MAWTLAWIRIFSLDPDQELGKFKAGSGYGINSFGSTTLVPTSTKIAIAKFKFNILRLFQHVKPNTEKEIKIVIKWYGSILMCCGARKAKIILKSRSRRAEKVFYFYFLAHFLIISDLFKQLFTCLIMNAFNIREKVKTCEEKTKKSAKCRQWKCCKSCRQKFAET